jgi:hypothetical protein
MNVSEITDKLGLHSLSNRNWYLQGACAMTGDGLHEGLDWLSNQLNNVGLQIRTQIKPPEPTKPILKINIRCILIGLDAAGLFN